MKTAKNVIFLLLVLQFCSIFGQSLSERTIVVIDPGHGGMDSGGLGINGMMEKDIVLQVAYEMVNLNEVFFNDKMDIYLTRYRDTLVSLSDRAKLAKGLKADLFISLHCNRSINPNASGVEVYAYQGKNPISNTSVWLGYGLQKELNGKLGFKSRGVKFADFQVLRETARVCPAVLVELGFLSHGDEAEYLLEWKSTRALALTILIGVEDYCAISN
ncbi:N-acetylmuramoyl-L-alanine amidase [Sinomicrobium pectinilyticum]|uniref:N-acetylmuramoyl-L-alanine amidase n=1 Tax=Sinomicrobium pectinilyticum TaxID=1084421 RepID=A0A3N0EIV8_SINP1|nr:N-acetylmuramoyl-L-alanine amidase [Sinomicrobium pectinilyticum]RNL87722.1 N-acetylmuramoyl-L-alanine amidase [Sinomicrobium pectinilyticum]